MNRDNVRVQQLGKNATFLFESLYKIIIIFTRMRQNLDRHLTPEGLLHGAIDSGHPTMPNLALYLIARDLHPSPPARIFILLARFRE